MPVVRPPANATQDLPTGSQISNRVQITTERASLSVGVVTKVAKVSVGAKGHPHWRPQSMGPRLGTVPTERRTPKAKTPRPVRPIGPALTQIRPSPPSPTPTPPHRKCAAPHRTLRQPLRHPLPHSLSPPVHRQWPPRLLHPRQRVSTSRGVPPLHRTPSEARPWARRGRARAGALRGASGAPSRPLGSRCARRGARAARPDPRTPTPSPHSQGCLWTEGRRGRRARRPPPRSLPGPPLARWPPATARGPQPRPLEPHGGRIAPALVAPGRPLAPPPKCPPYTPGGLTAGVDRAPRALLPPLPSPPAPGPQAASRRPRMDSRSSSRSRASWPSSWGPPRCGAGPGGVGGRGRWLLLPPPPPPSGGAGVNSYATPTRTSQGLGCPEQAALLWMQAARRGPPLGRQVLRTAATPPYGCTIITMCGSGPQGRIPLALHVPCV